ncbi:MAG TPA: response regulator, partial [Candidatus Paceibacterota bacterium]|nr:response regulator [Verrucomicrobiota bacterium]HRY52202.1 response regulator [Candidatus Paceibacterota bacterium]
FGPSTPCSRVSFDLSSYDPSFPPMAVVVNDDATQRNILTGLLVKAGIEAVSFSGAEDALQALNPKVPPALIVTDLYMPGIDGWRFCRLLRSPEYAAFNTVPILVVSATFAGDYPERIAADIGADAFLTSPVEGKAFVAQALELLRGKAACRLPAILLVDDETHLAGLLAEVFIAHGYRVDTASTAREAEETFDRTTFDMAVLDYHLPDGGGDALLDHFRAKRPDCVCIMMTGDPKPELALDWMKRGAAAHLHKPFKPEFLIELCAKARRERSLLRAEELLEERTRQLRDEHARLEAILQGTRAGTWEWNVQTGHVICNERWAEIVGYTLAELSPVSIKTWEGLAHPHDIKHSRQLLERHFAGQLPYYDCTCRMRHKDGHWVWVRDHGKVTAWAKEDRPLWMSGTHIDISEHKKAEEALQIKEERLEETAHIAKVGGWEIDLRGNTVSWTAETFRIHELDLDQAPSVAKALLFYHPDDQPRVRAAVQRAVKRGEDFDFEARLVTAKKNLLWIRSIGKTVSFEGRCVGVRGMIQDITERKQMELSVQRRDALLDAAARASGLLLTSKTPAEALDLIVRLLGVSSGQDRSYYFAWQKDPLTEQVTISLQHEWVRAGIPPKPDNPPIQKLPFDQVAPYTSGRLRQGKEVCALVRDLPVTERAVLEPQGIVSLLLMPIMVDGIPEGFLGFDNCQVEYAWTSGEQAALAVVAANISDSIARWRAEESLRQSEERHRSLFMEMQEGFALHEIICDAAGRPYDYRYLDVNPAFERATGISRERWVGHTVREVLPEVEDYWIQGFGEVALTGEARTFENYVRDLNQNYQVVAYSPRRGQFAIISLNITDLKRAEEEKEKLQAQLFQAQKMESVGRLAGGVAHDFNNMLQAILGNTALALMDLPPESPLRESLEEIQKSAQRSADLTRQLLAFARKQTIAPKVLDLNDAVTGTLKMLRRLIGEGIELAWLPSPNLGLVNMDPSQVDQLLANLCVNARDAIGGGVGKVTIETADAVVDEAYMADHPEARLGAYVRLAVSDNGCGISPEVRTHLFEPFFTTKELGQGTGLGLATVYGIVKQNKGFIDVYSEQDHGTTFHVYLPRHASQIARADEELPARTPSRGHETILLVEDEPSILRISQRVLENLGYRVLAASTPGEAIRLAREHTGEIHLLMTDVVMPEMNGRDLARNLLSQYPNLKRLFMSGYTANVIAHHGVLNPGVHFLQKPYSIQTLADKVREALTWE